MSGFGVAYVDSVDDAHAESGQFRAGGSADSDDVVAACSELGADLEADAFVGACNQGGWHFSVPMGWSEKETELTRRSAWGRPWPLRVSIATGKQRWRNEK